VEFSFATVLAFKHHVSFQNIQCQCSLKFSSVLFSCKMIFLSLIVSCKLQTF
jgi:hypothetical protein